MRRPFEHPEHSHDHSDEVLETLKEGGIESENIIRNPTVAKLYENALQFEVGSSITSTGALAAYSGKKTGRIPDDKRITEEESSKDDIWWGPVNTKLSELSFSINRSRAIDYLNTRDRLYVVDGFAGADPKYRIKVRVVCARAYHALFMKNMLIRPNEEEEENFGKPDFIIYNAGQFPANKFTEGMSSNASVALNFKTHEFVILGTEYAGEMKKGVFTIMHYLMPKAGILSLHSSCNEGPSKDTTLFFGLSGTGKTTLSADPRRRLIGDDEHCWSDDGVFNIEGGCYAKCVNLSREQEPEIFGAIRFGAILENVVYDPHTRVVNYADWSITQNTRCAYPIEFIENSKVPSVGTHPTNIIFLTCDGFGILPPVSKLTKGQAMYHFISGFTSKMPGTEVGINKPVATFSACYGQPFLALHPAFYANMLAEKMEKHNANVWLINTGWIGGAFGVGKRISIRYSRAIIDAIHNGSLEKAELQTMPIFNLSVPTSCEGVPSKVLDPSLSWKDRNAYVHECSKLASMFIENFKKYTDQASEETIQSGPKLTTKKNI